MSHLPETLAFAALLTLFAVPLAYAFAPGEIAAVRRWWNAPRAEDAALLARAAAVPAERPARCPQCGGRHCADWIDNGAPCPPQRAPGLTDTLLGPGLHEATAALRRLVPPAWTPPRARLYTLAERIGALPAVGRLP